MNTKNIPALVTLAAGLVSMIVMIQMGIAEDMLKMLVILLVVLIIFYIIGCIIKVIFDKVFKEPEEEEELSEEEEGLETEDAPDNDKEE